MSQAVSPLWILWELGGLKVHSDQSWRHRLLLRRGGGLGKGVQRAAGPREGSCQCLGLGEDTLAGRDCTCRSRSRDFMYRMEMPLASGNHW